MMLALQNVSFGYSRQQTTLNDVSLSVRPGVSVGLVGEYVGRIYQQVRDRPRYTVRAVLEADDAGPDPDSSR